MDQKVTIMVLKVDLQCYKCCKKVKTVLAKFDQIRDQVYDEKANTVTITVICSSPEKISEKLYRKGGGFIKSIQIKPPEEPKEPEEAEKKPEEAEKPEESGEKKAEKPKESGKKKAKKRKDSGKKAEKPEKADDPKEEEEASPNGTEVTPSPPMAYVVEYSYMDGYGAPGTIYYGRPVYDSWGLGGGGYNGYGFGRRRVCECSSDGNPQGCSIM